MYICEDRTIEDVKQVVDAASFLTGAIIAATIAVSAQSALAEQDFDHRIARIAYASMSGLVKAAENESACSSMFNFVHGYAHLSSQFNTQDAAELFAALIAELERQMEEELNEANQ